MTKTTGFSLVELSIVLVILGLLVGGVLTGQSLIRAAELRSVTTDSQRYIAAVNTFRDKYFALPGDMTNATAFWGKDNTRCTGNTGTAATPGTCNGDGDGIVDIDFVETYRFWQQLANAGLIEGSYNGYVGTAANTTSPTIGTEVPASKLGNAYWQMAYLSQLGTANFEFGYASVPDIREQYLILSNKASGYWLNNNVMAPEDAWNIDTKMDDGMPFTGRVRGSNWNVATAACLTGNVSTSTYNLTQTTKNCPIAFILK